MNRRSFLLIAAAVILAGAWALRRQHTQIVHTQASLAALKSSGGPLGLQQDSMSRPSSESNRPSSELLRLRSEVTLLRRDLESPTHTLQPISRNQWAEDWALVHSGPKPSEQPGFALFTSLTNAGFSTPEAAFQSFNYAMRNQAREPLNDTRMKELWDVPDDYDDPNARYSINLGEGMAGEIGYRIVSREMVATNQVRLTIDYEKPDGSSFRREKVLVENHGRWRMKPAGLTRAPNGVEQ